MGKEYRGNGVNVILDEEMLTFDKLFKKTKVPLADLTGVFFKEAGEILVGNVVQNNPGEFLAHWKGGKMVVKVPLNGGNEPFKELYDTLAELVKENLTEEEYEGFLKETENYNRYTEASQRILEANREFSITKFVGNALEVDEKNKTWRIFNTMQIHHYDEIVDFELLEDGESVIKGGGIGKAIAGGVLFGGTGAIVGAATAKRKSKSVCTSMMIKIVLNDMKSPVAYIKLIGSATKKDSGAYKTKQKNAHEILSILQLMCNEHGIPEEPPAKKAAGNDVDELRKLKALLDDGIINQEDFDAKKKQILGL